MKKKLAKSSSVAWTRAEAVSDTWQSLAIESLDPGPKVRRLANSYVRGERTLFELKAAIDDLDARELRIL